MAEHWCEDHGLHGDWSDAYRCQKPDRHQHGYRCNAFRVAPIVVQAIEAAAYQRGREDERAAVVSQHLMWADEIEKEGEFAASMCFHDAHREFAGAFEAGNHVTGHERKILTKHDARVRRKAMNEAADYFTALAGPPDDSDPQVRYFDVVLELRALADKAQ